MINISNACLQALQNDAVQHVEIEVDTRQHGKFTLTDKDLVLNGFSLDRTTSEEGLQLGTMNSALLKLVLDNEDRRFDDILFAGAILRVKLLIPLSDGKTEVIPFGVYTVDEQPRTWSTITLEAFDNLVRLDVPFDPSGLPDKMSLGSLASAGLRAVGLTENHYCGFPVSSNTIFAGIYVKKIKSEGTITWRQVLMWCCACAAVNGFADGSGRIKFGYYKKYTPDILQTEAEAHIETEDEQLLLIDGAAEGDFPLTPSLRFIDNMSLDEADYTITGVQFQADDEVYPENADMEYGIVLKDNLVFYAADAFLRRSIINRVNDALIGFTYRPYACDIVAMPQLEPIDSIDYIQNGVHYHSIVPHIKFELNGIMNISATAITKEQKNWASLGLLTSEQRAIIDSVNRKVDKTQSQLTDYETALLLFNAQMLHSMGLYKTVANNENGGIIVYFHDKPNLSESGTIYMFGTAGFAWTESGWNDGRPIWHYGFTSAGDAILNTINAYMVSAEIIKTGLLQSQNGASWINMDDGTFCFRSATPFAMDFDTGKPIYTYEKVLELANKQLNVYGTIKNIKYPAYSVSIGASERGNFGALNATFDDANYGDIFQVHPTYWYNGDNQDDIVDRGMTITSPFVGTGDGNRQSVEFKSSEVMLWSEKNLGSVLLKGKNACVSVFRDNINISTGASHRHCWFNYFQPKYGYSPIAYDFGNGAGGHADILCSNLLCDNDVTAKGKIIAGGTTYWDNCKLSVHGESRISGDLTVENIAIIGGLSYSQSYALNVNGKARANSWDITSDRNAKENIEEITELNALYGIRNMRFYSYDYKEKSGFGNEKQDLKSQKFKVCADTYEDESTDEPIHMGIGIIADEAPSEIVSEDGKGIKLYAYISYIAKGIQELTDIVKSQAEEISELKAKLQGSIQ